MIHYYKKRERKEGKRGKEERKTEKTIIKTSWSTPRKL